MTSDQGLIASLTALGFSQYEARSYVGLLTEYGQTAYALSKVTGVPQPKIYEAVRKLISRGAAVQVGTDPQRFAAKAVDELLEQLRRDYSERLDEAERTAAEALRGTGATTAQAQVIRTLHGKSAALSAAEVKINDATSKVYISAWGEDLAALASSIHAAEERGVAVIALAFGRTKFRLRKGALYRHASTAKVLYRSHRNRHLAVVVDGQTALWAVAFDDGLWTTLEFEDRRLIGLLRQFVRHDVYVQKIYADLRPEMESTFGIGLERLIDLGPSLADDEAPAEPAPATATKRRRTAS